jgi:hypothetical protein
MSELIKFGAFNLLPGKPIPFGATVIPKVGVNFQFFSLTLQHVSWPCFLKRKGPLCRNSLSKNL